MSKVPYDMSIHHNPSASAWTKFFRECNVDCNVDDDVMVGWFANAMMAMHDHIYQTTQPEQTKQEPAYIVGIGWQCDEMPEEGIKLYTSPKLQPLSDDEILNLHQDFSKTTFVELVRQIEKAHGIGGGG